MSNKLSQEKHFLKFLLNTNEKQQKLLIKHITKSQMDAIVEIVFNALNGNLPLSTDNKKKLKRYRHVIRQLVSKGLSRSRRKKILIKYIKQSILLLKPCETWLKN